MNQNTTGWDVRPRPPAGPAVVTQAVLAKLVRLAACVRRHRALVMRVKGLLAAGAGVEPGRRTATVSTVHQRRLTKAVLTELIGAELVAQLLADATPTTYHRLDVGEASPSPTAVTTRPDRRAGAVRPADSLI